MIIITVENSYLDFLFQDSFMNSIYL